MSVVDTLTILKGSDLSETEYFRAAVLGWCIELVRSRGLPPRIMLTPGSLAPSLLPRLGRHDGPVYHTTKPAVLVSRRRSREHRHQRLLYARGCHLPSH
jgi:hypothetical protein